ncbi:hypothetical protein ACMC5R_07275 [Deferribacteres bacterium DY0037]
MKKLVLISLFFSLSLVCFAAEKKAVIITSQPNYSKMKLLTYSIKYSQVPIVDPKTFKYISFVEAYNDFFMDIKNELDRESNQYEMDGVCNFEIKFDVTDKTYFFSASYDYFKYK